MSRHRVTSDTHAVVDVRGEAVAVPLPELLRRFGVAGIVRLHDEDFRWLDAGTRLLTHFNLAPTTNRAGLDYMLVRILRAGTSGGQGDERLPTIDLRIVYRALCVDVTQPVRLRDVRAEQFAWSLPTIRNVDELTAALERRYRGLSRGHPAPVGDCAITTFRMLGDGAAASG